MKLLKTKKMTNTHLTKRFDLNVGKRCNLRCMFCYYLEEINSGYTQDRSTKQIKDILKLGRRWGKTRVDLTGGEPTIRRDLPDIIAYARKIGYETVCIITNGIVTASIEKLKEYNDAGLNDILVSLHAHDAATHDRLVNVKGAQSKVLKTIENAKSLNIEPRINHVVTNINYEKVSILAGVVAVFQPAALNFIVLNPTRDAINADKALSITYTDVAHELRSAIEAHRTKIKTINVRHMPFCMLKGLERHVKTMWQLQYEKVEWDWCMDIIHKRGLLFMAAAAAYGMLRMWRHPRLYQTNWNTKLHDALQYSRILNDRTKPKTCRQCSLHFICDGVPKQFFADRGEAEITPYTFDAPVMDPSHFIPADEKEEPPRVGDYENIPGTPRMWFKQKTLHS
jgi:MoaA/NifB/PqqE/SkfB family radical SAM enzyme